MPSILKIRLAEIALVGILVTAFFAAWRAEREDRARLAVELATAKQVLAQADSRQHDRDAQLLQTLSALAAEKRTIVTPAEVLRDLPRRLPLPAPITLQPPPSSSQPPSSINQGQGSHSNTSNANPQNNDKPASASGQTQAVIPAQDLKPLYDFAVDCQACQAKLAAAQGDLADEQTKAATLTKERDAAIRVAKGGSILRRIGRAAKWFAIGAAAGAIAVRATH
jgi:type II secretory pathway pseudopilin PulG